MKLSRTMVGTLKEAPQEAELKSHELMIRAGIMRKSSSGIYNFMPYGVSILNKIKDIIKEEMESLDAQEILTTELTSLELLNQSKKTLEMGKSMFKCIDNNGRHYGIGIGDLEEVTEIIKGEIKSYKQLPINLYSINKELVDDQKSKNGAIRSRDYNKFQFYGYYSDKNQLNDNVLEIIQILNRIYTRCGVKLDKTKSLEFISKADFGDEDVVLCKGCEYIENVKEATCALENEDEESLKEIKKVATPNARTIEELAEFFDVEPKYFTKNIIYKVNDKILAVMVRGDKEINEFKVKEKLRELLGSVESFELADEATVRYATNAEIGFAGPIGLNNDIILVDEEVVRMHNFMVGANETGYHYDGVNYGRDFTGIVGDFKKVKLGDRCALCKGELKIEKYLHVGKVYNLADTFSKILNANILDKRGQIMPIYMTTCKINIDRLASAIIEQNYDENGIILPIGMAPYKVVIIVAVFKNEEQMKIAHELYVTLKKLGIEVILDDRDERAGVKFKDADLMGVPIRITVGKKISEGKVEFKLRNNDKIEDINFDEIEYRILQQVKLN